MNTPISWEDFLSKIFKEKKIHLCIGVFDGIHLGHQKLFNSAKNHSRQAELTVLTFRNNPAQYFMGDTYPGDLMTLHQKIDFLSAQGITSVIVIDFSSEFSRMTGIEFFTDILDNCALQGITVGYDFHCGKDNDTPAVKIQSVINAIRSDSGVSVNLVSPFHIGDEKVSSTGIRRFIKQGDLISAEKLMGHKFSLELKHPVSLKKETSLKKNLINQILPDEGWFVCNLEGNDEEHQSTSRTGQNHNFPGYLEISREYIKIHTKTPGVPMVQKIELIRKEEKTNGFI